MNPELFLTAKALDHELQADWVRMQKRHGGEAHTHFEIHPRPDHIEIRSKTAAADSWYRFDELQKNGFRNRKVRIIRRNG